MDETYTDDSGHYTMNITGKARMMGYLEYNNFPYTYFGADDFYLMDTMTQTDWDGTNYPEWDFGGVSYYAAAMIPEYMTPTTLYGIHPVVKVPKSRIE